MILDAGTNYEVKPCGLAARDSLRTGAGLPLSHQDIGSWPFIKNPWHFALPFNADQTVFTKRFMGDPALMKLKTPASTYGFVGYDLRKVSIHDPAVVLTADGVQIGVVLTCVTDMGIDRVENRIYSVGSLDKPDDFKPRGLCCGFHPPTVYFPLVVSGAIMIEPTETESKEDIDLFIESMKVIAREAEDNPDLLTGAPRICKVRRLDETGAARNPCLSG